MDFKNIKIIQVKDIPVGKDMPEDDLMQIYKMVVHMEQLCFSSKGVGLSAVQVGVPYNVFIALKDVRFEYFVNCSYQGIGEKINSLEGCLSLRNQDGSLRNFEVQRFSKIHIKGKKLIVQKEDPTLSLIDVDEELSGFQCIICQHEIDHAHGKLISDLGKEILIQRN